MEDETSPEALPPAVPVVSPPPSTKLAPKLGDEARVRLRDALDSGACGPAPDTMRDRAKYNLWLAGLMEAARIPAENVPSVRRWLNERRSAMQQKVKKSAPAPSAEAPLMAALVAEAFATSGPATVQSLVAQLHLQPHPEGGFYAETYRDPLTVPHGGSARAASTSVYFLITPASCSRLHRLDAAESWFFHLGSPLEVVSLVPGGAVTRTVLGVDLAAGQRLQHVVPAGCWFGSRLVAPRSASDYALVSCVVAPGFSFDTLELGRRSELLRLFPDAAAQTIIMALTNPE